VAALTLCLSGHAYANTEDFTHAWLNGKAYGDFRLRYEQVEQDNSADDASALTLRSRLGYKTGIYKGFSSTLEFEDSRVVAGQDNYELPGPARPTHYSVKGKSVIADPETTELDQAFVQYDADNLTIKAGRQILTYDNHRFVGHVGWRQDRQTFDAFSIQYRAIEKLSLNYAYLNQRNRIFGEQSDIDSNDHLFNLSYTTGVGKLSTYAYLLEKDDGSDNGLDTYGLRLNGDQKIGEDKLLYTLEYAYQESNQSDNTLETSYMLVEGGWKTSGLTAKLGYEVLGSKKGTLAFATPLATLHKFNGWTDQFLSTPTQGLVDIYLSLSGKLGGGKWVLTYHDFSSDVSSQNDDLGNELDVLYAKKLGKNYSAGLKYGKYSAGDIKVDTDKLWLWLGARF